MLTSEAWVPLAEIARPHGVRGEVRLRLFNGDSDLLLDIQGALLRFSNGGEQTVIVERARRANDAILMQLRGVGDRDRADELRGALLCVRRADFPPLEDGEFYACDVEGARVMVEREQGTPEEIGFVRALRTYPTADVLVVEPIDGGRAWEVPLVDEVVRSVDIARGLITLATMAGVERE